MLLQTNSYIVPKDKRAEHTRLLRRFRAALAKLGCDSFEVYEQVGANWSTGEPTGRYVQIMRFRDRRHQVAVQQAERNDPVAQTIIAEFCQLINFPYQQQQGLFAVGFYNSVLPVAPARPHASDATGATSAAVVAQQEEAEAPEALAEEAVADEEPAADLSDTPVEEVAEAGASESVPEGSATEDYDTAGGVETPGDSEREPASAESPDAHAAPVARPDEAPAESDAQDSGAGGEDDLAALLDAHLDEPQPPEAQDALDPSQAGARTPPHGLDALDLDDLELPDKVASNPQRAPDHAAR